MKLMRTTEGRSRTFYLVILGIIVVAAVVGGVSWLFYASSSSGHGGDKPYFSRCELEDQVVTESEEILLKTRIKNPGENTYEDLEIQIATLSPKVEMEYTGHSVTQVGEEYRLTVPIGRTLRREEETGLYNFDLGGELYPGVSSMTVTVNARIVYDDVVQDERGFKLTIKSG